MKYLIFIQTGGDMESRGACSYMYYTICEGETELDALNYWARKNNISSKFSMLKDGYWVDRGYRLQVIHLPSDEPHCKKWGKLRWE